MPAHASHGDSMSGHRNRLDFRFDRLRQRIGLGICIAAGQHLRDLFFARAIRDHDRSRNCGCVVVSSNCLRSGSGTSCTER